jgi:hypothetical protein
MVILQSYEVSLRIPPDSALAQGRELSGEDN